LIFQFVLFLAACLSLVAVVQQAAHPVPDSTSPDAPPPSLFVTTD
jgi:hypothetical protein